MGSAVGRIVGIAVFAAGAPIACALFMTSMPGQSARAGRRPLSAEELRLFTRLRAHVDHLAGEIGPRSLATDGLDPTEAYLTATWAEMGYRVQRDTYTVSGIEVANLYVEVPGEHLEQVLIGAHYDTVDDTRGADDNASGVASLLELSRALRSARPRRTIRFVAFVNEEPPFFHTDRMGSVSYSERHSGDVAAMISLESVGYFSDAPGSQAFPPGLAAFYPDRGDFVAVVGDLSSRTLVRRVIRAFRRQATVASEGLAAPAGLPGVSWSDHAPFWWHGVPAVMVTDTAPFRNPHYHEPSDTPETLDFDRLTRVVTALGQVVEELSSHDDSPSK